MKTPIAIFADLHARGKDLPAFRKQWEAALLAASKLGCRHILNAGDVFDSSNICDPRATTGAIIQAVMEPLLAHDFESHLVVVGNHDVRGVGATDALAAMEANPTVRVIRKPEIRVVSNPGTPIVVYGLPWDWTPGACPERAIDAMLAERFDPDAFNILLGHANVVGGRMNNGKTYDGASWAISRAYLDNSPFDRIALGHYHGRCKLVPGRGGYVGALRQADFGEEGNPMGFEVYTPEDGTAEWIEIEEAPRMRTVVMTSPGPLPVAGEREILRVQCEGWEPSVTDAAVVERGGAVKIETLVEYEERAARLSEVPEGIINRPTDIMRLWAESITPPIEPEEMGELETLLSELIGV